MGTGMNLDNLLSDEDVLKALGGDEKRLAAFHRWMTGQTVALHPDGTVRYYPWDFERFVKGLPVID